MDAERENIGNFFNDFIDSFRLKHPMEIDSGYTFWGHRGDGFGNNRGWRLDYFVLSPSLKDNIVDVLSLKDTSSKRGSDHCPLALYLKF